MMSDEITYLKIPIFGLDNQSFEVKNNFIERIRRNYGVLTRFSDGYDYCWIPWHYTVNGKPNFTMPPSRFFYNDKSSDEKQIINVPVEKTLFQKIKRKIREYKLFRFLKKEIYENNEK